MSSRPTAAIPTWPPGLQAAIRSLGGRLADLQPLAADGSDRLFFRLRLADRRLIILYHPHPPGGRITENDSYFLIGRHLRRCGVPVPEIFRYCRQEGWFLLEDLGDCHLQQLVVAGSARADFLNLYRQALELLLTFQLAGRRQFQPCWCFDTRAYDGTLIYQRECRYFVEAFLVGFLRLKVAAAELLPDFVWLIRRAVSPRQDFLLHRDFQSRNLLWQDNRLWIIDFQGARLGPLQYDVAALLLDPYVNLSPEDQETLLTYYLALLNRELKLNSELWRERYQYLALCRNLQILGAYGYLTTVKNRSFFRQFISPALLSLQQRLAALPAPVLPRLRHYVALAAERWFKNPD